MLAHALRQVRRHSHGMCAVSGFFSSRLLTQRQLERATRQPLSFFDCTVVATHGRPLGLSSSRCSSFSTSVSFSSSGRSLPASSLVERGLEVLLTADVKEKVRLTQQAVRDWEAGIITRVGHPLVDAALLRNVATTSDYISVKDRLPNYPSRPKLPVLMPPKEVPSAKKCGFPLPVYILHSLAHIELTACDMYWDTICRFDTIATPIPSSASSTSSSSSSSSLSSLASSTSSPSSSCSAASTSSTPLPLAFYTDFLSVIGDEARHFDAALRRLHELGEDYGCMPAHSILWEHGVNTQVDIAARLAIVPLVQEARGLDAGPRFVAQLLGAHDVPSANVVQMIVDEEERHVALGMEWFKFVCEKHQPPLSPIDHFHTLVRQYMPGGLFPPFNAEARERAGFTREWYHDLTQAPALPSSAASSSGCSSGSSSNSSSSIVNSSTSSCNNGSNNSVTASTTKPLSSRSFSSASASCHRSFSSTSSSTPSAPSAPSSSSCSPTQSAGEMSGDTRGGKEEGGKKAMLVFFTGVLPMPDCSAAGTRSYSLLRAFVQSGLYAQVCVLSTGRKRVEYIEPLLALSPLLSVHMVLANSAEVDQFLREHTASIRAVVYDRFYVEEMMGWRVKKFCPRALTVLDTQDVHFLRAARQLALTETMQRREELQQSEEDKGEAALGVEEEQEEEQGFGGGDIERARRAITQLLSCHVSQQWHSSIGEEDSSSVGSSGSSRRVGSSSSSSSKNSSSSSCAGSAQFMPMEDYLEKKSKRLFKRAQEEEATSDEQQEQQQQQQQQQQEDDHAGDLLPREISSYFRCDLVLVVSPFEQRLLEDLFHIAPYRPLVSSSSSSSSFSSPTHLSALFYVPPTGLAQGKTVLAPFFFPSSSSSFAVSSPPRSNSASSFLSSTILRPFCKRKHFVTIGNFKHEPNVDGLLWLKREIWPHIRAELGDGVECHVFGPFATPLQQQLLHCPAEGFFLKGQTKAAQATVAKYRVSMAALRFGAGIKGKIAEAWFVGTPVVTTSIGAEGMYFERGDDEDDSYSDTEDDNDAAVADGVEGQHPRFKATKVVSDDPLVFATQAIALYRDESLFEACQTWGQERLQLLYSEEERRKVLMRAMTEAQGGNQLQSRRCRDWLGSLVWQQSMASTRHHGRLKELQGEMHAMKKTQLYSAI